MKELFQEFARKYQLSDREEQVFLKLSQGVIAQKALSESLGVSPSTINNHLTNIFEKTQSEGKADVLSKFVRFFMTRTGPLGRRLQALVVDDEQDILEVLSEILEGYGLNVQIASSAEQALDALTTHQFEFVVSDVQMPNMDGFTLLQEIRKRYKYLPVVALISAATKYQQDEVTNAGAIGLFDKPIDNEKLFLRLMDAYINAVHEPGRSVRVETSRPINGEELGGLIIENIGVGGCFIPMDKGRLKKMHEGKSLAFAFPLADEGPEVPVVGEIVWSRDTKDPGVGVRFVEVSDGDRERLAHFVRLKRIVSFIPSP